MIRPVELPPDAGRRSPRRLPVDLDADVVVVGSGAGAGVVALEAARAGRSVVVVEVGPAGHRARHAPRRACRVRRLYLQGGFAATWDGSIELAGAPASAAARPSTGRPACPRPTSSARRWATLHGLDGFDGPRPTRTLPRSRPSWLAAAVVGPKDAAMLRGAAAAGFDASETRATPPAAATAGRAPSAARAVRSDPRCACTSRGLALGARILPGVTVDQVTVNRRGATGVVAYVTREDGSAPGPRQGAARSSSPPGALRTPGILERSGRACGARAVSADPPGRRSSPVPRSP